ncbi:ComEC/Rec2 family competence protein [Parasphaerochaeta coccoides]|uniref:ComEC/Rec2 family competence protein n=1 Tax=Parasphaerochaeta coccoides TaxID=273376 RepID=UPI0003159BB3|nr:ComEC/Rec2 family competence protein [Parasphaerochaeta coccoides]
MKKKKRTSPAYVFLLVRHQVVLFGIWLLIASIGLFDEILCYRSMILGFLCVSCSVCRAVSFFYSPPLCRSIELFCVLGCSAILLAARVTTFIHPELPFLREEIASVTGVLIADSTITDSGRTLFRLSLSRAGTKDGGEGGAKGNMNALVEDTVTLLAGTRMVLSGTFSGHDERRDENGAVFMSNGFQVISPSPGFLTPPICRMRELRRTLLEKVTDSLSSKSGDEDERNALALCRMMLLGKNDGQDARHLKEKAAAGGVAHVLALSGSHLAWISAVAYGCVFKIRGKCAGIIASSVCIAAFLCLAGPFPSLLRAAVMYFWGVFRPRRADGGGGCEALCAALFVLMVFSPELMSSTGCLMSFAAVIGMLHGTSVLGRCLGKLMPQTIASSLASSFAAMVYSVPFVMDIGGKWTPVGLLVTPPATVFSLVSLISGLLLLVVPFLRYLPFIHFWTAWRQGALWLAVTGYRLMDACVGWGAAWTDSHPWLCTPEACIVTVSLVLTGIAAILYAEKISGRHKKERHELEFRLRFPQCHQQSASGGILGNEQAVRTELPSAPGYQKADCRCP